MGFMCKQENFYTSLKTPNNDWKDSKNDLMIAQKKINS